MRRLLLFFIVALNFLSCNHDPESYIPYLEGYWEIQKVEKNGNLVKTYSISSIVDYFKVNDDLTGFRKKVSPTLDGKYTITDNESFFTLKIQNNQLYIYYTINNVTFKETIEFASSTNLIIKNEEGFVYTYKPFEPLN